MSKTNIFSHMLFVAIIAVAATAFLLVLNPTRAMAIECNGTLAPADDCPVVEQGAAITGNYRTAISAIGMFNKENTETLTLTIPAACTSGAPNIVRATAFWAMRDFDDTTYWDESVDIARGANPAVNVTSDSRYKVDMGGGAGSSYISDITGAGIIAAGTNTYTITNFDISAGAVNVDSTQWGFGLHAIYECAEYTEITIQQYEGHDSHWFGWGNAWDLDRTELICDQYAANALARTVTLDTFLPGAVDPVTRQADIWYATGTGTMPGRADYDLLTDVNTPANGGIVLERLVIGGEAELDHYTNTITLPAGDEWVCFQVDSSFNFTEHPDDAAAAGASMFSGLQWIGIETAASGGVLSLGDTVWEDTNNNGVIDGTETGVCGVDVHLYVDANSDNKYTAAADGTTPSATTTTSCGATPGIYSFTGLTDGDYLVVIPQSELNAGGPLDGYVSSTGANGSATGTYEPSPDPDDNTNDDDNGYHLDGVGVVACAVTLTSGGEPTDDGDADADSNLSVDFGFFRQAKLGNFVWNDVNANGIQDTNEVGIANATATLYDATDDSVVAVTTTDSDGIYNFCYLIAGIYYVIFSDLPEEATVTSSDSGDDDEEDSDIAAATLRTPDYDLSAGEVITSVDAGVTLSLVDTGFNTSTTIGFGIAFALVGAQIARSKGITTYRAKRTLSF